MAQPTAILRKEHEAIERMLGAAEQFAARLERGEAVQGRLLEEISEFFAVFVDKCHHGKEEEFLFPTLEKKGMPVHGGPIGVMLHEHEEGRGLARRLAELAKAYGAGDAAAGKEWAAAARRHARLLREHIQKENGVLFPMAEGLLSPAEEDAMTANFERMEEEKIGHGTHERLHARMGEIVKEAAGAAAKSA